MVDLLDLAARCEAASGPDDDLAMAIVRLDYQTPGGIGLGVDYDPELWMHRFGVDPTASLDAASMLVPEGYDWAVYVSDDGRAVAGCAPADPEGCRTADASDSLAATAALALTVAALRARASTTRLTPDEKD